MLDRNTLTGPGIMLGTAFEPQAVFSPDSTQVAYIDADPNDPSVPQIYVIGIRRRNPTQLTFNTEGVIEDLVWLPGGW